MADVKATATVTLSIYRDTKSVTRYYKLQTSSLAAPSKPTTNPPSSDWVKAEPACDTTKTLYFCDISVFSDGKWSASEVSKSSSYEASKEAYNKAQSAQSSIDNLEIGGRNLLPSTEISTTLNGLTVETESGSIRIYGTNTKTYATYDLCDWINAYDILEPDATYTISTTEPLPSGLYLGINSRNASDVVINAGTTDAYLYGNGVKKSNTFICKNESNGYLRAFFGVSASCGTVDVTFKIKLEKGNRATDWSPAPEDVDSSIADLRDIMVEETESLTSNIAAINGQLEVLDSKANITDVENYVEEKIANSTLMGRGFASIIDKVLILKSTESKSNLKLNENGLILSNGDIAVAYIIADEDIGSALKVENSIQSTIKLKSADGLGNLAIIANSIGNKGHVTLKAVR